MNPRLWSMNNRKAFAMQRSYSINISNYLSGQALDIACRFRTKTHNHGKQ